MLTSAIFYFSNVLITLSDYQSSFLYIDKLYKEVYLLWDKDIQPASLYTMLLAISLFLVAIVFLARYAYKRDRYGYNKEIENGELIKEISSLNKTNTELRDRIEEIEREHANSEKLYGMMLSSADDGIAFYNTDWEIKFGNSAFYSLIGLTRDEYHNINPDQRDKILLHPDDSDYSDKRIKALKDSGIYESELRLRNKDSNYIFLLSKSVEIKDDSGDILGYLVISRDITSIKETQNELLIAKEKAEESNRLKSTFLANISHEIRTPLNSIVGFANLLNDLDTDDKVREEYVGYLNQNTERLLQIISDIIDLSRLENSEIEIHYNPVRINSLLDFAENYAKELITRSGKEIELHIRKNLKEPRDVVYADEVWLKRVFRHIVDNAVKFTRSGSIEIKSAMAGTSMMFTVKDTGIGISKDNLKSIFEQFRQESDGHHRPFEGLGVGLTLTKQVIEEMDGYLWVESEKGAGSEFFFTIPYRPVESTAVESDKIDKLKEPKVYNWKNKKILIADDNHDILKYLHRILSDTGVTVIQARSGEEALSLVKENDDIDLILLDMQMEEMNGLEATKEIRKIRKTIPIVAQTAFLFEEEQDFVLEAGCDACLIKPVRKEQLYSVVSNLLDDIN